VTFIAGLIVEFFLDSPIQLEHFILSMHLVSTLITDLEMKLE